MIATLSGVVSDKLSDLVILDVAGVGYGLFMTTEDYSLIELKQPLFVHVYEYIREQAHDLFGFTRLDSKQLFEQLLEVNGVGPKMALNVLSVGTLDEVRQAIASGDTTYIRQASGVGKRVAERVIIELKDKVGLSGVDLKGSGLLSSDSILLKDEAVEALVALGYSPQDAAAALKDIDASLPTAKRITLALKAKT